MAGPRATISGRGYDLWQRRVSAMAVGSEHHSVHAHQGQHSPQEKPVLWSRAFYLRARIQSLHLSRWPATQLWWSGLSQSRLRLYWNPQTLRCVFAKNTVHQCPFPLSEHSPARSRPATRQGLSEHARVRPSTAAKKEAGSTFRGTQESDRVASPTPASIEVRAWAVLPSCGCAEHQGTLAQPSPAA